MADSSEVAGKASPDLSRRASLDTVNPGWTSYARGQFDVWRGSAVRAEAVEVHVVPAIAVTYGLTADTLDYESCVGRNAARSLIEHGMLNLETIESRFLEAPAGQPPDSG